MKSPAAGAHRRARRALLPAALAVAAVAAGCGPGERRPAAGEAATIGEPRPAGPRADRADDGSSGGPQLVLGIEPRVGDAPLTVALTARLEGIDDDPDRFRCATAAFALGDDNVQLLPPAADCADTVQTTFVTTHTYAAAGSYRATARLLARPVAPSRSMQVLARGPTPTAAPLAANPGPTIVIATPDERPTPERIARGGRDATEAAAGAPDRTGPPRPSAPRPPRRPTAIASATAGVASAAALADSAAAVRTRPAATAAAPPTAHTSPSVADAGDAPATLAVLPADLYYLGGRPARLWRLPASGEAPEAIDGPGEATDAFAVSTLGFIARRRGGAISVLAPTGGIRSLVDPGHDGEDDRGHDDLRGPVWSRDGHLLAYRAGAQLRVFDVVSYVERDLGAGGGAPLGFSRDGQWLLVGFDDGAIGLIDVETGAERVVALGAGLGQPAGWLADRNVLWSAGAGLRFVTVADPLTISPVIDAPTRVSAALVRSDRQALVLVERGAGSVLAMVDLASDTVRADVVGAPIDVPPDADLAWAPDGRTVAVADADGLALVDPATGARVPLVRGAVRQPVWVISGGDRRAAADWGVLDHATAQPPVGAAARPRGGPATAGG